MIDGTYPVARGPFDLYDFVTDRDRGQLLDRGMLPWWSHPKLKIRFFRPLASILRFGEQRLLGRAPLPLHLHSLVWWLAAVAAVYALFKRLLADRPARIATIAYALAPCHTLPLAWLANREALLSITFGATALVFYTRWRESRHVRDALLSTLAFSLAVASGEYALCFGGYVVAYELFAARESIMRRLLGLMPFAIPSFVYLAARASLGYGTKGSGFYADPLREPQQFLVAVPRRLVTLLAQTWFSVDDESLPSSVPFWVLAIIAVAGVALLAKPLARALRDQTDERRRAGSWLLVGSIVSLAPVLAVVPSPRVVGTALIGAAACAGILIDHVWFPSTPPSDQRRGPGELAWFAALALAFAQLVHAPMTSWLIGERFRRSAEAFAHNASQLRGRMGDPTQSELLMPRAMGGAFFMPFALTSNGQAPARWRVLSQTGHVLMLRRDERSFDLVVPSGETIFPSGPGNLFRSEDDPLHKGDRFALPGLVVTVLEIGAHGPRSIHVELDQPLEASPHAWTMEQLGGFPAVLPPRNGAGLALDP